VFDLALHDEVGHPLHGRREIAEQPRSLGRGQQPEQVARLNEVVGAGAAVVAVGVARRCAAAAP
jgi:hypothetical protein